MVSIKRGMISGYANSIKALASMCTEISLIVKILAFKKALENAEEVLLQLSKNLSESLEFVDVEGIENGSSLAGVRSLIEKAILTEAEPEVRDRLNVALENVNALIDADVSDVDLDIEPVTLDELQTVFDREAKKTESTIGKIIWECGPFIASNK